MKIRKLTGILLAAVMTSAYVPTMGFTVSAEDETVGNYSQDDAEAVHTGIDDLFGEGGLKGYLADYFYDGSSYKLEETISDIQSDHYTGEFPVILSAENIKTLQEYSEYTISLTFEITDKSNGITYKAVVTDSAAMTCDDSDIAVIKKAGGINLSLNIIEGYEVLRFNSYNNSSTMSSVPFPITYKVSKGTFLGLVEDCNLWTGSISDDTVLGIYAVKPDEDEVAYKTIEMKSFNQDFVFELSDKNRKGIFLKKMPDDKRYYTQKEAEEVIKNELYDYLGLGSAGAIDKFENQFTTLKSYIFETAIPTIKKNLSELPYHDEIMEAIEEFCDDHKEILIEKYIEDLDFSDELEDEILEILGADPDKSDENTLKEYIYKMITEKFNTYTVSTEDILKVIDDNIESIAKDIVDVIKNDKELLENLKGEDGKDFEDWLTENGYKNTQDFIDSISGEDGKSFEQWLTENGYKNKDAFIEDISSESFEQWLKENGYKDAEDFIEKVGTDSFENWLKEQGYRDTTSFLNAMQGKDGQSFEDWLNTEYKGDKNDFMSDVFDAWISQQFGTRESFLNNIRGAAGESAYDIAVRHGYRGTEQQWIDSLQGANGLSAYELAKQEGYKGTLNEWLDSLHGKDGKDGEDGADGEDGKDGEDGEDGRDGVDGRDGQIVYVNGTYGQVPETGSTDADVILIPSGSTPSAGNVNPATGVAAGVILPAAAIGSVMLVKKQGRKRGRK